MNGNLISRDSLCQKIHTGMNIIQAMQTIMDEPTVPGPAWVSVKDKLPEHGDEVLVVLEVHSLLGKTKTCIATAVFTPPKWWAIADYDTGFVTATDETDVEVNRHRITYWMLRPELPKEG